MSVMMQWHRIPDGITQTESFTVEGSPVEIVVCDAPDGTFYIWAADPAYGNRVNLSICIPCHELADDPQSDWYARDLVAAVERRCHGLRRDGLRCRSYVTDGSGYCRYHVDQATEARR